MTGREKIAPTVELSLLTKTFGDVTAVDAVDAVARPGEVTASKAPH